MGTVLLGKSSLYLIMKMFVVLALAAVAVAEPEADPQVFLSGAYASPLLRHLSPYTYTNLNTYNAYNPYYNPYVHSIGKRDAEAKADPAVVYHSGVSPLTGYPALPVSTYSTLKSVVSPVTYTAGSHLVNPVVNPFAYTAGSHIVSPVTYSAVAPVTHKITNYNSPSHYTAESYGAFGPQYIAKNHGVEHIVKREADPLVTIHGVSPYNVYTGLPATTYTGLPTTYTGLPATTYTGLPATTYTGLPSTYTGVPVTYTGVPVLKHAGAAHAVAATPFGVTHSSNVGVCTNNNGEQVSC